MEIYFLNESFDVIDGPMDEVTSAVAEEKYFEVGSFSLKFPRAMFRRASDISYVLITGEGDGGICGRVDYVSAVDKEVCEIGGGLLETVLFDIVMRGGISYSGTLTDVIRAVLRDNLDGRGISVSDDLFEISDEVTLVSTWGSLGAWLYGVLRPYGASVRVKLVGKVPTVSTYCGRDLTSSGENPDERAVFSASLGNIHSLEYEKDTAEYKNFAYVIGGDGTVVTLDKSGGKPHRETVKNAADIKRESYDTDEEYVAALERRGEEILSAYPEAVSVFAECDEGALPVYGRDYLLGDICDAADEELGLSFALRVSAVSTVFENGQRCLFPTFGYEARYADKLRLE